MKNIRITKIRTLQSGRHVYQMNKEIPLTISTMCPSKWLFVDMETGDVWRIREGEFDQKENSSFWRHATKTEIKDLKQLKVNL